MLGMLELWNKHLGGVVKGHVVPRPLPSTPPTSSRNPFPLVSINNINATDPLNNKTQDEDYIIRGHCLPVCVHRVQSPQGEQDRTSPLCAVQAGRQADGR